MSNICCSILDEFKDINFKDRRLNDRFSEIMHTLETSPSGLISKSFVDAKDQKAAYRFFENSKADYNTMLGSHQQRVKERCKGHTTVLAIQDSSSVLLHGARKADRIDNIGNLKCQHPGLNIHTSLLVTPQQEVLGIADIHSFERQLVGKRNKAHFKLSATKKETGRWLRAITNTRQCLGSDIRLVWVADREGDFWDYFSRLNETKELFVQRVVHKREMQDDNLDYFSYVKSQPIIGTYSFEIPSRGGEAQRQGRLVTCEVRTVLVTLKKPKILPREMKTFQVRAIHVIEQTNDTPLEWFLITNIDCESFEEILEKIQWYKIRWVIEELHRVVKSGCGVEEMRLEDKDRLMKYLLLLFIVGMRILWITKLAKQPEEIACTKAFSDEEWKMLYVRKYKKKPEVGFVPSMKEALKLLAILGGFYEYNKKRVPGQMTIWRGMRRLRELLDNLETIQILRGFS
ncbi:MAG: IS4 family transposase [Nitrosotalea sp.]